MTLRAVYPTWQELNRAAAVEFQQADMRNSRTVSADNGDAAKTLIAGRHETTQRWATNLTAARAVTLDATAWNGARFRIVRTGGGAFNLDVGTGPLKSLAANTWCDVEFDGTAWFLSAYGAL